MTDTATTADIDAAVQRVLAAQRQADQQPAQVLPYDPPPFERQWQERQAERQAAELERKRRAEEAAAIEADRLATEALIRRYQNWPAIRRLRREIEAVRVELRPVAAKQSVLEGQLRRLNAELTELL